MLGEISQLNKRMCRQNSISMTHNEGFFFFGAAASLEQGVETPWDM